jgi:hypothetical protein
MRGALWRILGTALLLAFGSTPIQSGRAAESAVVTLLMLKELADIPGKEMLMITVDYPPGALVPFRRVFGSCCSESHQPSGP